MVNRFNKLLFIIMDYDLILKRVKKRFRCEDDENESCYDSDSKKKVRVNP